MSSTVSVGGFEITSNTDTPESMVESLTPSKPEAPEPKVVVREGKAVETEEEAEAQKVSEAARELGKKGGEAAAQKRAAEKKATEGEDPEAPAAKDAKDEKPLGKPRDDPKARMLEATRKEAEAKREAARERARAEQLERELQAERARAKPAEKPKGDEPPKPEDFGTYDEYVDARARYAAQDEAKKLREAQAKEREAAQHDQEVTTAIHSWGERLSEAVKSNEKFVERTYELVSRLQPSFMMAPGQPLTPVHIVSDEIISSEHGPALLLHLSDHPKDLQRILALRSVSQIQREMAKLEARVEAVTAGTSLPPSVSRATPPVRPVTGSPITADPDLSEVDFDTHMRLKGGAKAQR